MAINSLGYQTDKNPIAQSIYIDDPEGIYATKINVYFKSRLNPSSSSRGQVNLQLRPMRNGFPSITEIIPSSNVYLDASSINTSVDGSIATTFEFEEPVFLEGLRDFAIVLYSPVPDYEVYISEIDSVIIGSNSLKVNKNPSIGSLFYTQNGATFTANQKQDLKFELYRADFLYNSGTAVLHNAKVPRKKLIPNPIRTRNGDSEIDIYAPGHGLNVNDTIGITGLDAIAGISASSINTDHTVIAIDLLGVRVDVGTNANADAVGGGSDGQMTINYPYQAIYPFVQALAPANTTVNGSFRGSTGKSLAGTETPYTKISDYNVISLNKTSYDYNKTYTVMADSIESVELGGGQKSIDMQIEFSGNSFSAPMIDLQRSSITLINNQIDNQDSASTVGFNVPLQFSAETEAYGGSSISRHVTRIVKLNEQAVGLKIIIAANVPTEASFDLYFRGAPADENIRDFDFTEFSPLVAMPKDNIKNVFREYEYLLGGAGGNLTPFEQFQLKIVMKSTNQAKVPVFKDLRTIALAT